MLIFTLLCSQEPKVAFGPLPLLFGQHYCKNLLHFF